MSNLVTKNNLKVKLADGLIPFGLSQVKEELGGITLTDLYNVSTLTREDFSESEGQYDNVYRITNDDVCEAMLNYYIGEGEFSKGNSTIRFLLKTANKDYVLSYTLMLDYRNLPIYNGFHIEATSENSADFNLKFNNNLLYFVISKEVDPDTGDSYVIVAPINLTDSEGTVIAEGIDIFNYIESISMLY